MRLVKLLDDHGMKGTFNLNSGLFSPQGTTSAPGTIHRRMTPRPRARPFSPAITRWRCIA